MLRDWLRSQDVDTSTLLRMAGIDEERFNRRDSALVPLEMEAFIASARRLTGRSDLGFELGRLIKMTSHDLLGYGMLSCRTIDEVMRLVVRHYHLMTETFTLRYRRAPADSGEALYVPAIPMPLETLRFYLEALAVAHDNQIRLMLGNASAAFDIYIAMPAPAHLNRYQSLSPTRFHFDESDVPSIRVVMGSAILDCELPLADVHLAKEIDRRCSIMGQRPPSTSQDWVQYLRMVLRQFEGESPTLECIALLNHVSSRTIDRHLRRENLSFRDLLNEARFERACELLRAGASVSHVAGRLGFSDSANFSRAFRRTIGMTPSAYRELDTTEQLESR